MAPFAEEYHQPADEKQGAPGIIDLKSRIEAQWHKEAEDQHARCQTGGEGVFAA